MSDLGPPAGPDLRPYSGPAVAFPLGGVGTGNVSIGSDGSLRQWQLVNQVNHRAEVPGSGFAIRVCGIEPPRDHTHLLRAIATPPEEPAPLVSDHESPPWPDVPEAWRPVDSIGFRAGYPFAVLDYRAERLPVEVSLEAHTPFVPLDLAASSQPVAAYRFRITNPTPEHLYGFVVATQLNIVGWDGVTPIDGTACDLFGHNVNSVARNGSETTVEMRSAGLDPDDPANGTLALWTNSPAAVLPCASSLAQVLRWVESLKLLGCTIDGDWSDSALRRSIASMVPTVRTPSGPSRPGHTWLATVACAFSVAAGQSAVIELALAWHFPNRVVNFDQFGPQSEPPSAPIVLGNAYAAGHASASAVVAAWARERYSHRARSQAWADLVRTSSLPDIVRETLEAQPALVRSPTVFVGEDGTAFGFEGGLGASTRNWNGDVGGSCPLTCTHVWNYAQALAGLFPDLERTMRDVEWRHVQAPDGHLPHRVRLPMDGPQLHGVPIGGPIDPALDGMLGAVLKTYREVRALGDVEWLRGHWDSMCALMSYVAARWDDGSGVLRGRQPVTFDIDLTGPNLYVGSLWIAALAAMARMASVLGLAGDSWGARSHAAAEAYDGLLWNGEYYGQVDSAAEYDFGAGCLTDQLLGQWWAHQLDLGHLLPADRVRSALDAVLAYNFRDPIGPIQHGYRVFADEHDSGVVVCSWPRGGRPAVPTRYADEVWSGSEYALSALLMFEGMTEPGLRVLRAVRGRQDGSRRNPFNEIECGDHYARAMSGWSLLAASTGVQFDAVAGELRHRPIEGSVPFVAGSAWGAIRNDGGCVSVEVIAGTFTARLVEDS